MNTRQFNFLIRCTQEKHRVTDDLAVSRAENEALQNKLQLFNSQREDEKNKLRSQVQSSEIQYLNTLQDIYQQNFSYRIRGRK